MFKKIIRSLKQFHALRNYLVYQLFLYFWFALAIMLAIALLLPKFDARSFLPIEDEHRQFFNHETQTTDFRYNIDEVFEGKLHVVTPNDYELILLDQNTGIFSGVTTDSAKPFQIFLYEADDLENPLKRRFDNLEIYGPFDLKTNKREYFVYFTQTVSPQKEFFNRLFDSPWLMLVMTLLASIPILLWLSWQISRPVKQLLRSANAVAIGDLAINEALEKESIYEFQRVGKSFNQMIASLQQVTEHQQRLLSDISHELKTPLARLQLSVALIRRRNGESSEITRIENQISKLDMMIRDLLSLSRQQINQHLTREIFPINQIWDAILEDTHFEIEQNNLNLFLYNNINQPQHYFINGNPVILTSALENLLRNAQKYATKAIEVSIFLQDKTLIICVDDDGAGVPETEYEQIFRPFYRVEEDRARQSGGTGLGLAIVANAIQQHKGTVKAMKSPLGGLRVEMSLPLWIE